MNDARLRKDALAVLEASDDERIGFLEQPRWINYTRAKQIIDRLEYLYALPKRGRMPCMLLVGETNNGKTELVRRFMKSHASDNNLDGEAAIKPVIYVQSPPEPSEGALYDQILQHLFEQHRPTDAVSVKRNRVTQVLARVQLRMLFIDEIHSLLAGSAMRQRSYLNCLKFLSNDLNISIIGIGTEDAARAMASLPEIENRFKHEALPGWVDSQDLNGLLSSFERYLPLRQPSNLFNVDLAAHIVSRSDGKIGEMSDFITAAAIHAIHTGTECVTIDVLRTCGYLGPFERKERVKSALRRPGSGARGAL